MDLVTKEGDWLNWISFFLRAVREQAKISKERVEEIEKLYRQLYEELPKFNSKYASTFLEALFKLPIFSPKDIAKAANITNSQTIYNLIRKFSKAGLVSRLDEDAGQRGQLFIFNRLMRILD